VHWVVVRKGLRGGWKAGFFWVGVGVAVSVGAVVGGCEMVDARTGASVVVVAMLRARQGCCMRCERRKPEKSCFAGAAVRLDAMLVRICGVGVEYESQAEWWWWYIAGSQSKFVQQSTPPKRRKLRAGREHWKSIPTE
jgi:hypothetical protein